MVAFKTRGGNVKPSPKAAKGKAPGKQSKTFKRLNKSTRKFYSKIQRRQVKAATKRSTAFKVGKKIGDTSKAVGRGIGVKGALYITAGLTMVFVIARINKEVKEWKPGDVIKAIAEDPINLMLVAIVIGVLVWLIFFRRDK